MIPFCRIRHAAANRSSKTLSGNRYNGVAKGKLWPTFLWCSVSLLSAQNGTPGEPPTFKSKVQAVLVDVVVTDRNDQPIKSLQKDDFEIFENGESQTIASFEEHQGASEGESAHHPPLPPHTFSNAPMGKLPGSINALLLDALNTEFGDQATVRLQMIDYLKKIDPGPRLAIFTLSSRLQMVEGFTADPKLLLEALNRKNWGAKPTTSPMLRTQAEDNMDQTVLDRMSGNNGMNPGAPAGAIEALRRFQAEMKGTETLTRMSLTLDALKELSRYLSGFEGRKNIIWFSGSFPQIEFPSAGERTRVDLESGNGLGTELRQTINMMAAAQIAVYPIAAQGLETQGMYQAEVVAHPMGSGATPGERTISGHNQTLSDENSNRYINQKAAFDLADNTGGKAFVNTNGLKEALAEAVHNGAYYYRLSYYPSDKRAQGRYRHIRVRVKKGSYPTPYGIAYRRGYYEENEKQLNKVQLESVDPLEPLMKRGLPDSTELLYNVGLVRSSAQPGPDAQLAGDNKDLKPPLVRYNANFVIPLDNLTFDVDPDGVRHGDVELALVAYDHAGRPLNWIVRSMRTTLKPSVYPAVQKTGVQFHQEIDVPSGDTQYLRSGIYDLESNTAGTIEVPLSEITNADDLGTKPEKTTESSGPEVVNAPSVAVPSQVQPPGRDESGGEDQTTTPSANLSPRLGPVGPVSSPQGISHRVVIDVIATDKHRRPIRDLGQNDLRIFEKVGFTTTVPEKAASFRFVDKTPAGAQTPNQPVGQRIDRGYNNVVAVREPDQPLTILLLDGLNTNMFSEAVRVQVSEMLNAFWTDRPKAPMAVFFLGSHLHMLENFTTDTPEVVARIRRLVDAGPSAEARLDSDPGPSPEMQQQFGVLATPPSIRQWDRLTDRGNDDLRVPMTLGALRSIARYLAGYAGRKKLMWLSGSFPFKILPDPNDSSSTSADKLTEVAGVANALSVARIALYPIRTGGTESVALQSANIRRQLANPLMVQELSRQNANTNGTIATMEQLARETGGSACAIDASPYVCLKEALADGYTYYELAYYPARGSSKPGLHRIQVVTTRPGVSLEFRRVYYAFRQDPHGGTVGLRPHSADAELRQAACDDPMAATGVAMSVSPVLSSVPGTTRYLLAVNGPTLRNNNAPAAPGLSSRFNFAACTFDASGTPLQYFQAGELDDSTPAESAVSQERGLQRVFELRPSLSIEDLRWVVRDEQSGAIGSVDLPYRLPASGVNAGTSPHRADNVTPSSIEEFSPSVTASLGLATEDIFPPLEADADVAPYCEGLQSSVTNSAPLIKVCEFSFSLRTRLPNIISERKTSRHWQNFGLSLHDQITTKVVFRDGIEYDQDDANGAKGARAGYFRGMGSTSSGGEFYVALRELFVPGSNADFTFSGEKNLSGGPALIFNYNVNRDDNRQYYLSATLLNGATSVSYPGYRGSVWIDKASSKLLRLYRDTSEIQPRFPINYASTIINYQDVPLGDGTRFVLPVNADAVACSPGDASECAHNIIRYNNYQKFRATTNIVFDSPSHSGSKD